MEQAAAIVRDIKSGIVKPLYLLMGEEPYYIDRLSEFIEENILDEAERGFNQSILYGRDVTAEDIVSTARRYPMMAERQVVIIKEAQDLKAIEQLDAYAENPMPTTVLVLCYKYKSVDKRKKLLKSIEKNGVVFESKKLYDNQIGDWIKKTLSGRGTPIEPKAVSMLTEFIGSDLSKLHNELEKLEIILGKGNTITAKSIEENIGFSKDFNNFELIKAIGVRDEAKAYRIIQYFADNPRDNPLVVTTSQVFRFFVQLLQYHGLQDRSQKNVAAVLKINPFFVKDFTQALQNFPMKKVSSIVATLRDIDVKSKGVGANLDTRDLLREMMVKIFM